MKDAPNNAAPGRCDIWWREARGVRDDDIALLDEDERNRAGRLHRDADRARFVVAAALLRRKAALWLDEDPRSLAIDRVCMRCGTPHGKPTMAGVHASITHAGDYVGVALTALGPVGLDLEPEHAPVSEVAAQLLAPGESCADDLQLVRMWTRKESVVKATGDGVGVGLSRIRITAATSVPELRAYPGTSDLAARMTDLIAVPGYIASATVLTARSVRWVEHHDH